MISIKERKELLRKGNDLFRSTLIPSPRHKVMVTEGVNDLEEEDKQAVIGLVRNHSVFEADNDPHKEHDFGAVKHKNVKYFWKIDYYDLNLEYGVDPIDTPEEPFVRVLTIMRADEY